MARAVDEIEMTALEQVSERQRSFTPDEINFIIAGANDHWYSGGRGRDNAGHKGELGKGAESHL